MNTIPQTLLDEVIGLIEEVNNKLSGELCSLTSTSKRRMPILGKTSYKFVSQALQYGQAQKTLMTGMVDMDAMNDAVRMEQSLRAIENQLTPLLDLINDTAILAGSEAYSGALSVYRTLQMGARIGIPQTRSMANTLKERFINKNANSSAEIPTESTAS